MIGFMTYVTIALVALSGLAGSQIWTIISGTITLMALAVAEDGDTYAQALRVGCLGIIWIELLAVCAFGSGVAYVAGVVTRMVFGI